MNRKRTPIGWRIAAASLLLAWVSTTGSMMSKAQVAPSPSQTPLTWLHLSTAYEDLAPPGASTQQTSALVADIDRDGVNDFVIAARRNGAPSVVWYQRHADGWHRYVIEPELMDIEAGGDAADVDGDGDIDLVFGGDQRSNQVWWWENPYPAAASSAQWTRRLIKNSGSARHHDLLFGDFDGDGQLELVFWNQLACTLWLAERPADPHGSELWPLTPIFGWSDEDFFEGLAKADIDGDGLEDIVGGGRWFKRGADGQFEPQIIDDAQRFSRAAVGQLVAGGPPEVVLAAGDWVGPLKWYQWDGSAWTGHDLLAEPIDHGHSLSVADINGDGFADIFAAEMRLDGSNPDAHAWLFLGDGLGNFTPTVVATGYDHHESLVADLDGDGDLDILGKPYNYETPRLDLWLNQTSCLPTPAHWQRHLIDPAAPWTALFVLAGDLDGDGLRDVAAGGWWYRNPGVVSGPWPRHTLYGPTGVGINNVAALYDFDGDEDLDLFGSAWNGQAADGRLVWARNDGAGIISPTIDLPIGAGDFLQGVAIDQFHGENTQIALSWHRSAGNVQLLRAPADPATEPWGFQPETPTTQSEALSAGDIDRDGHVDLLLGTQWLRNLPTTASSPADWEPHTLVITDAQPDRNRLADLNLDGRLDAVVGYEAVDTPGLLAWYAQPENATATWTEHPIATILGPMSLDVADMDSDGDLDVVAGEHAPGHPTTAGLFIFENMDGLGNQWRQQLVYRGDEHHDGAQVVDIDNDGDLDILSIGWSHRRIVLYENRQASCSAPVETPTPTFILTPTITNTLSPPPGPTVTDTPTTSPQPDTPTPTQTSEPSPMPTTLTDTPTTSPQPGSPTPTQTSEPSPVPTTLTDTPTTSPQPGSPTPTQTSEPSPVPTAPLTIPTPPTTGHLEGLVQVSEAGDTAPIQADFWVKLTDHTNPSTVLEYEVATSPTGVYGVSDVPVGYYTISLLPPDTYAAPAPIEVVVQADITVQVQHLISPMVEHWLYLPLVAGR